LKLDLNLTRRQRTTTTTTNNKRKTTPEATGAKRTARAAGKILQQAALWPDWHSPNPEGQEEMQIS
jgi:hypothetical protein